MQNPLAYFIRSIQNAKSASTKEKDAKKSKDKTKDILDSNSSGKVLKCSKMIPNLVYQYEQYEQQLKLLNKHFKNKVKFLTEKKLNLFLFEKINFTENFEIRLRDFEIVLGSGENRSDEEEESYSPRDTRNETARNSDDEEIAGSMINESDEAEMDES